MQGNSEESTDWGGECKFSYGVYLDIIRLAAMYKSPRGMDERMLRLCGAEA